MRCTLRHRPLVAAAALAATLAFVPLAAEQQGTIDYEGIYRIKDEGFQRSQVMNIMSWLTDVYGPRLTNAPGFRKAGDWAVKEMTSWGRLTNVKLEPWGPFGKGWTNDKFYAMATTPGGSFPLIGMSTAWTPGTNGLALGDAIVAVIETPEDMAKFKGQLRGKFVLTTAVRDVPALWTAPASRYTDLQLKESRAYVTDHFADRTTMAVKPDHAKFAGYFNVDNGTGAIRGVYLQGNEAIRPVFETWMKPFNNLGMDTLTIRDTGGTDHQSFDAVGLPGFQFIQDAVEYDTRTHHSNMDVYERIQEEDMRKNAVIVASFVYLAANRDEKLPRKPLPRANPGGRGTGTGQ